MSQSNALFLALALAFIIFVTLKGQLSKYISLFRGDGGRQQTSLGDLPRNVFGSQVIVGSNNSIEQGAEDLLANNPLAHINQTAFGSY